ncbi:oligopeptide transporter, OPT family [Sphingomonas cannabina]|uniref:OPT family oligopeptide transporter n=1 Tax=Sphingomonas cannabina TaxID=2899123 RepID=UPI001F465E1E|nr:oligopeptide transporter, OPT family [Sphingomonas cannabina]UIJ45312.1 oligopeptide transporter, OPT family [Sphingomonas cannabina]
MTQTGSLRELTLRGVILGGLITLLFTAANVYLGLKVGLTFATSIPAAVISMAILRFLPGHNILENNIVQTIASAAGTLAAIIFVLPGLIMVGWWTGFPYWTSVAVCATGGVLGVMFSVPLRRALVTGSDLPYPEGVAAAEVLKVGAGTEAGDAENAQGLRAIVTGSLVSAFYSLITQFKFTLGDLTRNFRVGATGSGYSVGLSMALLGVGHLVGLSVGFAMLTGTITAWVVLVPLLTSWHGLTGPVSDVVSEVFRTQVRFIGAGAIGVAAVWALLKILGPIIGGIRSAMAAAKARGQGQVLELTERDLPIGIVGGAILLTFVPIAYLLWAFAAGGPIADHAVPIILATLVYVVVIGVVIASVCGYMAGLIGASNSPVSGVGILAILGASLMLAAVYGNGGTPERGDALVAYALFATAIIFSIATISNDNLQDLKTGQLVGATPWKQQVALVIGVAFGSLVIPPVLDVLNIAFGFSGAPNAGPNALPAPQAALISSLAKGVLGGTLDWRMIGTGAVFGVVMVAIDEALRRNGKMGLPPLAFGMGIYLPMSATLLVPVGAVIGHFWERTIKDSPRRDFFSRMGVLVATGLIVGESLFGVVFAGIVAATGSDAPLALIADFEGVAVWLSLPVFAALIAFAYRRTLTAARASR